MHVFWSVCVCVCVCVHGCLCMHRYICVCMYVVVCVCCIYACVCTANIIVMLVKWLYFVFCNDMRKNTGITFFCIDFTWDTVQVWCFLFFRCILATDMAKHSEILANFKAIIADFDPKNKEHKTIVSNTDWFVILWSINIFFVLYFNVYRTVLSKKKVNSEI